VFWSPSATFGKTILPGKIFQSSAPVLLWIILEARLYIQKPVTNPASVELQNFAVPPRQARGV
jgi:hypothetical protein